MLFKVCALLVMLQGVLGQQSHPQLQAYLAQQQQLQLQQQQQPARQQYRLVQATAAQAPQRYVQQYADDDGAERAAQYQQAVAAAAIPRPQPQYQAQLAQPVYRTSPAAAPQAQLRYRPAAAAGPAQQEELQNPEDYDPNPQYQFGFDVKDDQFTNYQNRKEQREGDKITGSYSVVDSDGFIRTVTYTADPKEGFKAEVTRTPTDIVVKLPTPPPAQLQEAQGLQRQLSARQQQYLQAVQAGPESAPQPQYVRPSAAYAQPSPAQLQQLQLLAAQQRQHGGQLLRAAPSSSAAAARAAAAAAQGYSAQASNEQLVYQAYQQQQ